ncbi:MAG: tRNA threonylcarbamoyladenosine dehydratase [Prevotella sp.]|nr:tRNA threonylcarbamoyladenosine dehydratase [Prevotella sp.]
MLVGPEAMQALARSHVAVFGVGGVGGYAVEVLARSGVGSITVIDNDRVDITNLNRQIIALHSTIGQLKVDVIAKRIADINPLCKVTPLAMFYLPENAGQIDLSQFTYVVDCIDTVSAKVEIIRRCHEQGIPVISSMGAARKMNPAAMSATDISETHTDPLAKIVRKKLRKFNINHLKVVFSDEQPINTQPLTPNNQQPTTNTQQPPPSNAFVPAAAGIIVGSEVVKDIIAYNLKG